MQVKEKKEGKKMFKGKSIYNPSGKAGEYSYWACNFYVGCSNECTYCYLKKGRGAKILGGNKPELKKCFKNSENAIEIFEKELLKNKTELQEHGLFFSFSTDPLLNDTKMLTVDAIEVCQKYKVPVKLLTKRADFFTFINVMNMGEWDNNIIAFGFTLTGHDELEPKASKNYERIEAMKKCKELGYKTFASIEPIIDFPSAKNVINASIDFCDLYKIGLMSGKKYDVVEAQSFVEWLDELNKPKIYLKESLQKLSRYTNTELGDYFVERDYNLFS